MKIQKKTAGYFGEEIIDEYTLTNSKGLSLSVLTYGAMIKSIRMPNREGVIEEITVNIESLDDIIQDRPFHGTVIGPVAGRIANGSYFDGQKEIQLDQNEQDYTLHGGFNGLDNQNWSAESFEKEAEGQVILRTCHQAGESGFPGNIEVTVIYTLNEQNEVKIEYKAQTDQKTLFNPTNHVYFNLSGTKEESVAQHELFVNSDYYAVLDEKNIPTGELRPVNQTDFDFNQMKQVETILASNEPEIVLRNGLDHPFIVKQTPNQVQAKLYHPKTGRLLEMRTDAEAVIIYTHNHHQLTDTEEINPHSGIALETSSLPNAVNQPEFSSIWLEEGEEFQSQTTFTFTTN